LDFSENDVTLGEKARWGYVLDFQGRRKNWDHGSCGAASYFIGGA